MKGIVTEYNEICAICGKSAESQHHLIYGNGRRALAEADGLKIPCCHKCHNMGELLRRIHDNPMAEKLSKMVGQLAWEKHAVASGMSENEAREAFRLRYDESYL